MRREHFELLWDTCAGQEIGHLSHKEKSGIPLEIWADWEEKRIVGPPAVPPEVFLEDYGLTEPAIIVPGDKPEELWAIPQEEGTDGRFPISRSAVEMYPVWLNMLARDVALSWGLEPAFEGVPPCGHMIGRKDGDTPVVVLHERLSQVVVQALEIKEALGTNKLLLVAVGETDLSASQKQLLSRGGITFAGTVEFLTVDGEPRWEAASASPLAALLDGSPWSVRERSGAILFDNAPVKLPPLLEAFARAMLGHLNDVTLADEIAKAVYPEEVEPDIIAQKTRKLYYRLRDGLPGPAKPWLRRFPGKGYGFVDPSDPHLSVGT